MGGKAKGSTSLNPWEALFSSATRPRAVNSSYNANEKDTSDVSSNCNSTNISTANNNTKGGYTILIQHSITSKSQRQWALSSTMAQNNNNTDKSSNNNKGSSTSYTSLSSGISTMNINKRSQQQHQHSAISSFGGYGISGLFLVRQSLDELCHRCNGAVIFVSTIGNSSTLDMKELLMDTSSNNNNIRDDDEMLVDGSYHTSDNDGDGNNTQLPLDKKHRNAIHMFKRHGACVDLSSNPFGWDDDDTSDNTEGKDECDSFIHKCSMNKLQPIANVIRKAALSIESRRGSLEEEQLKSQQQTKQQKMHQPIPIVFESMTPLLNVHGVDKVCVLLESLGRALPSTSDRQSTMNNIILSPIVVHVLYESLQPSEHRSLEDVSDAFVHLNLAASCNSVHQHESSSNDNNSASVMSGIMDLVRRGGSGGLGGKFIRHCIPFHIMKSVSNNTSSSTIDARDDCYWILEHDEDEASAEDNDKKKRGSSVTKSKREMSSSTTNQQQDSADTSTTAAATVSSRPRIFLQDDDPEYDDYDEEEDLDDDLDL